MARTNRPVVALAVLGTVLAVLVPGAQAAAPDPIVGYWKGQPPVFGPAVSGNYPVIQVTGPNGDGQYWGLTMGLGIGFDAAKPTCTHPGGEVIWQIAKTVGGYTGTHRGFADADTGCASNDRVLEPAVWVVNGDQLEVRVGYPGGTVGACGSTGIDCFTFVRVTGPNPPAAPPTTTPPVQVPTTPAGPATPETPPVTPSPGKFKGRTSQHKAMSFTVRRHRITAMSFVVRYHCPDGYRDSFTFTSPPTVSIVGGKFSHRWDGTPSTLGNSFRFALAGAFPSAKRANGAIGLVINIPDHGGKCTSGTPTWTARHT